MVKFPKLPKFKGGSKGRKKVLMISGVSVVAVIAVIAILYYTNPGFKRKLNSLLKLGGKEGPLVDTADTVDFTLSPEVVPPNTEFNIIGQFKDKDGDPVRVKQALFYIINNATGASGPRELLLQGTIGNSVGKFTHTVSTNGFPRGSDYDVIVTDRPLSVVEIEGGTGEALADIEGAIPVGPKKGTARSTVTAGIGVGGVT
jgi:hypothetical protein